MSANSPTVAVLVSGGRHPVSGTTRACRNDAVAMALGRRIAGDALRVIHAGDPADPALKDYLAFGAGRIDVLAAGAGADPIAVLANHVRGADIILTGQRAERGEGSGFLPYMLARILGRPIVAGVLDLTLDAGEARLRQFLPKGKRRRLAVQWPLVATVHTLAPVTLTYAHARGISGKVNAIAPEASPNMAAMQTWAVEDAARRPNQLTPPDQRDGHDRMISYVETQARGGAVVSDGSAIDKAQIVLSYLRNNQLVDF